MTIETARRASLEFVCVFGQDAEAPIKFGARGLINRRHTYAQDKSRKHAYVNIRNGNA